MIFIQSEFNTGTFGETITSIADQLAGVLRTIRIIIDEAKADPAHLVKLTAFYVADGHAEALARSLRLGIRVGFPAPVLTLVQVAALPTAGQRLQIDGVCIAA